MSNRDVLQRFYEAEARFMVAEQSEFEPVAATLHPDCLLCEPASLPYGGEWRGWDGVERWMRMFKATWSSLEVRDSQVLRRRRYPLQPFPRLCNGAGDEQTD